MFSNGVITTSIRPNKYMINNLKNYASASNVVTLQKYTAVIFKIKI